MILDGEVIALTSGGALIPSDHHAAVRAEILDVERLRQERRSPRSSFDVQLMAIRRSTSARTPAGRHSGGSPFRHPTRSAHRHLESGCRAAFALEALAAGHEGVMAKSVDGLYARRADGQRLAQGQAGALRSTSPSCRGMGNGRRRGKYA